MSEILIPFLKLVVAALLGGLVGIEREVARKPAGLRTNILICTGAALFTIMSVAVAGGRADPGRIAAQIIPGIGFIGAGAIIQSRGSVAGLTTAATIFVVAAIGLSVGSGSWVTAVFATALVTLVLSGLRRIERRVHQALVPVQYTLTVENLAAVMDQIESVLADLHIDLEGLSVSREGARHRLKFSLLSTKEVHSDLIRRFSSFESAIEVHRETTQTRLAAD